MVVVGSVRGKGCGGRWAREEQERGQGGGTRMLVSVCQLRGHQDCLMADETVIKSKAEWQLR